MATYYVDTNHLSALDTNSGLTEALPWKTIQKAAATMVAGDTVYIKQGTYGGSIVFPENSGTASGWITYSAYPGHEHKAILDGYGFQIKQKSYIKISGLRVQNTQATASGHWGIYVEGPGANFITISNNYTYNTLASGIAAFGVGWPGDPSANSNNWKNVTNLIIENNQVECANNGGYNENITLYGGVDTFEVRGNKVFNSCDVSLGGEGIDVKEGGSNGKIYGNEIWNLKRLAIYLDAAGTRTYAGTIPKISNIEVFNNHVHNIPTGGLGVAIVSEGKGSIDGLKIYNNVIRDTARGGIDLYTHFGEQPEATFNNISIFNNTAYNTGLDPNHGGSGIGANKPNATNVVVRNNISYNNDLNLNLSSNIVQSNNLTTDPHFVNAAGGDFHLRSTSPAINAGTAVGAPAIDFDGVPRPQGAGFDIGAFEFTVVTPTTYKLKRSLTSGGPYTTITPANFSATSFIDTLVANGTNYRYVATANNQNGESINSNEVSLTPTAPVAPAVPTLSGSAGNGQVSLTWNASAGATDYRVKRGTASGGPYTLIATVTGTAHNHAGLTNGQTGRYVVSARNGTVESANSNEVSLTPSGSTPPSTFKIIFEMAGLNNGIRGNAGRPNFNALHAQLYTGMGETTKWRGHAMVYHGTFSASDQFGTVKSVLRPRADIVSRIRGRFGTSYAGFISIDFEGAKWNLGDPANAPGYVEMIRAVQEALPNADVGHYDVGLKNSGYIFALEPGATQANYNAWHNVNVQFSSVRNAATVWFGSLYPRVFTSSDYVFISDGWIDEQVGFISNPPRISYPVINQDYKFHDNNSPYRHLHNTDVPKEYFRAMLDLYSSASARARGVDGVVIWTGNQGATWDQLKTRPFWQAIWEFLGFSSPPPT